MGSNPDTTAALPPPDGQVSNFVNPDSIQPAIIGALTICLVVSTLSGILRLVAQWTLFKKLVRADFWMILGWAFSVAFAAFLYACLPYGAGRHQWNVTKTNYNQIQFLLFIDFILYDIAILGPKVAILLQLKDIFAPRTRNRFYWTAIFLIGVNIIFYIALSFALIFQCDPVARGWDPTIQGKCLNQDSLLESSGPFNIISDFLIFLLPISAIWKLQLPIKTRLGVASAFAVGLFGCVCSAVRLYYSNRLDSSGDATYLIFQNQLWANAEIATGLLIANIIIVPRFIRHQRGISSTRDYTYPNSHTHPDSRARSQQAAASHSRQRASYDPYIKLESTKNSHTSHANSNSDDELRIPIQRNPLPYGEHHGPNSGIVRTVQIDTTEELIQSPTRVTINNQRVGVAQ